MEEQSFILSERRQEILQMQQLALGYINSIIDQFAADILDLCLILLCQIAIEALPDQNFVNIIIMSEQQRRGLGPQVFLYNHTPNKPGMRNKTQTRSNADTEDGDEDDFDFTATSQHSQSVICDVWAHNFDQQLQRIATLADEYPIISLDTEFPGNFVNRQSISQSFTPEEIDYQFIWHNVQKTKLIQIGITLANPQNTLCLPSTWQFHLSFDLKKENTVPESIALLEEAGIAFRKLKEFGIPASRFAEGFISSGLILNKGLKWVVFHGCFDFAYFLRLLRDQPLPRTPEDFYKSIHIYFPNIYDIKEILKYHQQFRDAGLNKIAARIGCHRVGPNHQAGSDSLLTIKTYFQLRSILGSQPFEKSLNFIYGITKPKPKVAQYEPTLVTHAPNGPLYQYLQQNQLGWHSYNYSAYTGHWYNFNRRQ